MLLGAAGIAEVELSDADTEALTWIACVLVIAPGFLMLFGLAIICWTSRNRVKVCGQIAGVIVGLALIESLITWLRDHS